MYAANEIGMTFWTEKSIKDEKIGKEIIQYFFHQYTDFLPLYWYGGKYKNAKVNTETPTLFLATLIDNTKINNFFQNTTFTLTNEGGRKKNNFNFSVLLTVDHKLNSHFSFSVSHSYFNCLERTLTYLDIGKNIIELLKPFYGKIHDIGDSVETRKRGQTMDVYNKIPRGYWINYFGEMYIDKIGEKKLKTFSAFQNEKIGKGLFIQLTESPFDFNTKEFKEKQKRLEKIIGKKFLGYKEVKLPFKL